MLHFILRWFTSLVLDPPVQVHPDSKVQVEMQPTPELIWSGSELR